MHIMDRTKQLCKERNVSAPQLAVQFGKTEAAVRAWKAGRSNPDVETLIKLAEYFNCSTDYLLGLTECRNVADYENRQKVYEMFSGSDGFEGLEDYFKMHIVTATMSVISQFTNPSQAYINIAALFELIRNFGKLCEAKDTIVSNDATLKYETGLNYVVSDKESRDCLIQILRLILPL